MKNYLKKQKQMKGKNNQTSDNKQLGFFGRMLKDIIRRKKSVI